MSHRYEQLGSTKSASHITSSQEWNRARGASPLSEIVTTFERTLQEQGIFGSLRYLNSTTEYRFTGIYHLPIRTGLGAEHSAFRSWKPSPAGR